MKGCKVCGRDFRSGRRVHVAGEDGKLARAIVCSRCADEGLCIVLRKPETKKVEKVARDPQLDAIKRRLSTMLVTVRDGPRGDGDLRNYLEGKIDGLSAAVALVDAAQEGRPL